MELRDDLIQPPASRFLMIGLAFFVGILGALGAILFRLLVALVHNLAFSGNFSFIYKETLHTLPSVWGLGIVIVPMIGALVVTWIIENFASDERGLSVPEVMYRVRTKQGRIEPRIALAKTMASMISLGTGASLGREGPVVQIGAALGAFLETLFSLSLQQRALIAVAGAAAATAVIFNAPLSGIAFALELLLASITVYTVLLVVLAVTAATCMAYVLVGSASLLNLPVFTMNLQYSSVFEFLLIFIPFGIMIGLISVLFIRGIYWVEDALNRVIKNPYLKHLLGMSLVGMMIYSMFYLFGHYYIEGLGLATIQDALQILIKNPWLLLLLFSGKLIASCITLGSGASGGVFSPALFLGATLGGACGLILNAVFPHLGIDPVLFVVAGMAGMLGCVTGAIITAFVLTFELTQGYSLILPMMITVVSAYIARKQICQESIYTLKLERKGLSAVRLKYI